MSASRSSAANGVAASVVVPIYNAERTVAQLIQALKGLLPTPSHEILLVDNASNDGTRAIIDERVAGDDRFRVLREPRRGPSAARNRGLRDAVAQIVAFVDADCVPTRTWLRELVAAFDDPDVVLVAGGLASYPPRTGAQRFAARYGLNDASRTVEMAKVPFANSRNMAVRRAAALDIGGFDERITQAEDVEFSFTLRERFRAPITYRESALCFHQDREDDESLRIQAFNYGRGMASVYSRHPQLLRWGSAERFARRRIATKRRLASAVSAIADRLGWGDAQAHEFDRYLNLWSTWFWRGFDDGRRSEGAR